MIFVTVGEQLPFDRLVRAVDEWAATSGEEVFAQIGATKWKPQNIGFKKFLDPEEFIERLQHADLIVGHAGMGTIITALEKGKQLLVLPRQSALGEHRNDHQLATAKRFQALGYIMVAMDEFDLSCKLKIWKDGNSGQVGKVKYEPASQLIDEIRRFVEAV